MGSMWRVSLAMAMLCEAWGIANITSVAEEAAAAVVVVAAVVASSMSLALSLDLSHMVSLCHVFPFAGRTYQHETGVTINTCNVPGTVAITFDDGPHIYTSQLLDLLARYGAKSTFFLNGLNFGDIRQAPNPDVVRRMVAEGHQVGSHTYQHADLNAIDSNARRQQMGLQEEAIRDILGFFPTYMRPPYGNCDGACLADMNALGYHVINWSLDSRDWELNVQNSINIFDGNVQSQTISLEHDVHATTVQQLAEHFLQTVRNRGLRAVTVGECLGDSSGNWYRDATTGAAVGGGGGGGGGGLQVSTDGTCASNSGGRFTCQGSSSGNCCSVWGWW